MLAIDDFLRDIFFFTLAGAGSWFMGTFRLSTITTLVRGPADACDDPVAEVGLDLLSAKLSLHKWFLSRLGSCLRRLTKTSIFAWSGGYQHELISYLSCASCPRYWLLGGGKKT